MRNPLQVPIQLTDVQLVCTHVPVDADAAHEQEDSPRFLVEPFNHVLRAQEKQKVLRSLCLLRIPVRPTLTHAVVCAVCVRSCCSGWCPWWRASW